MMKKKLTALIMSAALGITMIAGSAAGVWAAEAQPENTKSEAAGEETETVVKDGVEGHMITDMADNEVFIPNEVDRVVVTTIYPMASIITVFLDSGAELVGMHPACMSAAKNGLLGELYPEVLNADTSFMDGTNLNLESLIGLEPDVVFYNAGTKEIGEAIRGAGMNAVAVSVNKWNYDAIETYKQWISLLAEIFPERSEAAEKVNTYSDEVYAKIQERVGGLSEEERKKVLFLFKYDDTAIITSGKNFFGQFWCDAIGAKNVAEGVQAENDSAVITMEQVYEWNPDVIFVTNFTPAMPEDLYTNAIGADDWSPIAAVQNENVYKLPLGTYRTYTPGIDTPFTLLWMAQKVYPELFEDININQEVKDYYKDMYGVELTDEQVELVCNPTREAAEGTKK